MPLSTSNFPNTVPPKIAPFDFGDEPLNYGETASVQCTVLGGDLPINVTWLLNNKTVEVFADISIAKIGKRINVLSIEAVSGHHAGHYSCFAENRAGATSFSAQLTVNGTFFERDNFSVAFYLPTQSHRKSLHFPLGMRL